MGDGELTNQHPAWEILWEMLREILAINAVRNLMGSSVENAVGNSVGNLAGNSAGNGLGNDAIFSLNMWLRTIYCLQTIHKPTCVISTLFNNLSWIWLRILTICRTVQYFVFIS